MRRPDHAAVLAARLAAAGIGPPRHATPADDALFGNRFQLHQALDPVTDRGLDASQWNAGPLTPACLGRLHQELQVGARDRKDRGSYFTEDRLVRATVERAVATLDGRMPERILDPAAGAGAFLLGALDALAPRDDRAAWARRHLFGIERDPVAASVARWSLWLAAGRPEPGPAASSAGIIVADALTDPPPADGFDLILGNPPWETVQPMYREFFAAVDPGFRDLDARRAKARMAALLEEDPALRADWQRHGEQAAALGASVRAAGSGYDHQGRGKLYTYRLFVERSWQWLRPGGVLAMIVPGGLYLDSGAAPLRRMLLDGGRWEWLYGFENRAKVFPIDSRYRFAAMVVQKGGSTRAVRVAFSRTDVDDWAEAKGAFAYRREWLTELSPTSETFVEARDERDLALLARIHGNGEPFVHPRGPLRFAQGDLNMTSDAGRFVPVAEAAARGFSTDACGRWRNASTGAVLEPLMQGAMLWNFHPFAAAYDGGAGHRTRWRRRGGEARIAPQFLVDAEAWRARNATPMRAVFRTLSNATNERTAVASCLFDTPCGNSIGCLSVDDPEDLLTPTFAAGVLGSLVYDWTLRVRMGGTNLNRFVLQDTVWPVDRARMAEIASLVASLAWIGPRFEPAWRLARQQRWLAQEAGPTEDEIRRRALCVQLDVAMARAFGLGADDLGWILRDCSHPAARLREPSFCRDLDPRGFWRVDRDAPPEQRHPLRVLRAFAERGARRER